MNANTHIGFGFKSTIALIFFALTGISSMVVGFAEVFSTWPPTWGKLWGCMKDTGGDWMLINLFIGCSIVFIYYSVRKHKAIQELNDEIAWYKEQQGGEVKQEKKTPVSEEDAIAELEADWKSKKYEQDTGHWERLLKTNRIKYNDGARTKCLTYLTYARRRKNRYANVEVGVRTGEEISL